MSLPDPTRPRCVPALVELIKAQARDRAERFKAAREFQDEWNERADNECEEEYERLEALWDGYHHHPAQYLIRLLEEHAGIPRETGEEVVRRINTVNGLAPLVRTRRPASTSAPEEDEASKPDLLDLRWVFGRLNECDANDTAAAIFTAFAARYPASASTADATPPDPAPRSQQEKAPGEYRQKVILSVLREEASPLQAKEIAAALKLRSMGTLKRDLAWMVRHDLLVKVRGVGYWLVGVPIPNDLR